MQHILLLIPYTQLILIGDFADFCICSQPVVEVDQWAQF